MRIIKAVFSIPQVRERDLLKLCKQLNLRTSGDISLAVLVRYDGAIWQANCSKTGEGWGYVNRLKQFGAQIQARRGLHHIVGSFIWAKKLLKTPEKLFNYQQFLTIN